MNGKCSLCSSSPRDRLSREFDAPRDDTFSFFSQRYAPRFFVFEKLLALCVSVGVYFYFLSAD